MRYDHREQKQVLAHLELEGLGRRPLDDVFTRALKVVREALDADCCGVVECAPDGSSLLLRAGRGWRPELVGLAADVQGDACEFGYVIRTGEPLIVGDVSVERRFASSVFLRRQGVASSVLVPVRDSDGTLGVLGAHSLSPRCFTADDLRFLQDIAKLLSSAWRRYLWNTERAVLIERATAERKRAQAILSERSGFLARLSHELRTPLSAIAGYVDLMELGVHGPLTTDQRADLQRLRHNQRHLLEFITTALDFEQVSSGRLRLDPSDFPVDDALAEVEDLVRPQMALRRLRYEWRPVGAEVRVRADRNRLRQILVNLLANAVKFTPLGGQVRVHCEADANAVRILVCDTGCGIPPDRLEAVFEPFVQLAGGADPPAGVGLGLSLSRELAQGMGGSITAESVLGQGATFTVVLPRGA